MQLRGFFAGSGSAALNIPETCQAIIHLSGKERPTVLYLGTATYDLPKPREAQTQHLATSGCLVTSLDVACAAPPFDDMRAAFAAADVIVVSGGNTLFAIRRWAHLGVHDLLREAMLRGVVLSGGSAGAACWFDACHSDSMDPETYKAAMLQLGMAPAASSDSGGTEVKDEASSFDASAKKRWDYIRVPCLGFLPGLVCPHHDRTQSNGVPRATDFNEMMLRHRGEMGLCIDHWAALIVEGDSYRVFRLPGKEGSVKDGVHYDPESGGLPGIWTKSVSPEGEVVMSLVPSSGKLSALLRPATAVVEDPRAAQCSSENPIV